MKLLQVPVRSRRYKTKCILKRGENESMQLQWAAQGRYAWTVALIQWFTGKPVPFPTLVTTSSETAVPQSARASLPTLAFRYCTSTNSSVHNGQV